MAPINPVLHQLMAKSEEETPSKKQKVEDDLAPTPPKTETNAGLIAADISAEDSVFASSSSLEQSKTLIVDA